MMACEPRRSSGSAQIARSCTCGRRASGFTLIELLVVIAILVILAALTLSALGRARTTARATACRERLRQVALAVGIYHDQHGMFPGVNSHASIDASNSGVSYHWSFQAAILPALEQGAIYDRFDFRVAPHHPNNLTAVSQRMDVFLCPADQPTDEPRVNYVVNFGTWVRSTLYFDGIYTPQWKKPVTRASVRDGLSYTALLSETLRGEGAERLRSIYTSSVIDQAGWTGPEPFRAACSSADYSSALAVKLPLKGGYWWSSTPGVTAYNHIMLPNQSSCVWNGLPDAGGIAASSLHPGGVNLALADGSARFVSQRVSAATWWALGSIAGGEVVSQF